MEVITFTEKLAENSKYHPEFTDMRIILNIKTNEHRMEVYNEISSKIINSCSIQLKEPFINKWSKISIFFNKNKNRYCVDLYSDNKFILQRTSIFLSKYIFITNRENVFDGYEVDHLNGNRLDDRIENLICITSQHNKDKDTYAFWLDKYNKENNTNYQESDLGDINTLNKVKQYLDLILPIARKDRKQEYIDQYRIENKSSISKQRKEYRKNNLELMKNSSKHWREENREYIKEKTKEYNNKNKDIINERNNLSRQIDVLLKKKWTPDIGILIKQKIERILELWNLTFQDISSGLSTLKYKHHTINNLNKLMLVYYDQNTKLNN